MAIIYSKSAQNCILLQRVCQRYFPAQVSSSSNQTNSHIIPNCKFQTRVRYFSISSKKQSTTPLATAKQDPKYFNYRWSHEQPGCPKELSIVLKNDPQNFHDKAGNYSIATSDQINGRSYWVSSNDKQAIWYENKSWRVGDIEDLGTGICGIYSTSTGEPNWPNETFNWHYFNGKEWIFAYKDIKLEGRNVTEVVHVLEVNDQQNKFKNWIARRDLPWSQDPKGGRGDLLIYLTITMWMIPAILLAAAMKCAQQNIDMPDIVRSYKPNAFLKVVGFGDDANRKQKYKIMEDRHQYTSFYSGNTYDNIRR